jgi:hypothetical protein
MTLPYLIAHPFASGLAGASSAEIVPYISAVVFVAGFFSFGFGGLVYSRFERDLRVAVDRVRLQTLSTVQVRYWELFSNQRALSAEESTQLDRFKGMSDYLSKSGYLRGSLQNIAIIVGAILPPLVSMVGAVLAYLK